jgi:hypothetical protein
MHAIRDYAAAAREGHFRPALESEAVWRVDTDAQPLAEPAPLSRSDEKQTTHVQLHTSSLPQSPPTLSSKWVLQTPTSIQNLPDLKPPYTGYIPRFRRANSPVA